jgi:hypothetical protein
VSWRNHGLRASRSSFCGRRADARLRSSRSERRNETATSILPPSLGVMKVGRSDFEDEKAIPDLVCVLYRQTKDPRPFGQGTSEAFCIVDGDPFTLYHTHQLPICHPYHLALLRFALSFSSIASTHFLHTCQISRRCQSYSSLRFRM